MSDPRDIFGDRPIRLVESDRFGRIPFSKALCRALCLPPRSPSFVVAVEGGWGTGKTSILNIVETLLSDDPAAPLVMRFEPWPMSGSNSLIEAFLVQLASLLGREASSEKSGHVASNLLRLAQLLKPLKLIPGVEPWGTLVQTILESAGQAGGAISQLQAFDLTKTKKEIAVGIRGLGRPIVVMIDDIDRLNPREIRQIFRLVKAVADFERVAYFLAYDPAPVTRALSYQGTYDGAAYAEKIVQVAYPLPQLDSSQFRHFLLDRIRSFVADYNINLEEFEEDRLSIALSRGGIIHALRNVRDVTRLVNRLRVSVPTTRGEVSFADILVFESMALRFPWIIEAIRSHPEDFLLGAATTGRLADLSDSLDNGMAMRERKNDFWEQFKDAEIDLFKRLLDFLFPGFASEVSNEVDEEECERELRICVRPPLFRLLATGHLDGLYSAQEARLFLEKESARASILESRRKIGNLADWFLYLDGFIEDCVLENPVELVQLMAKSIQDAVQKEGAASTLPLVRNVRSFFAAALKEGDSAVGETLYLTLAADSSCLSLSVPLVLAAIDEFDRSELLPPSQRRRPGLVHRRTVANEGGKQCLLAIRKKALKPAELLREPEAVAILVAWGRLSGGYDEVHRFVERLTDYNNDGLQIFIEAFHEDSALFEIPRLVPSLPDFQASCETHPNAGSFRPGLWDFFERTSAEANQLLRSIPPPPGSE